MFEFLNNVSPEQALSSGHYAIRLITHIAHFSDDFESFRIEGLKSEPTDEQELLTQQIIAEIKSTEHVSSLKELSRTQIYYYIDKLYAIINERLREESELDENRAEELLQELRQTSIA